MNPTKSNTPTQSLFAKIQTYVVVTLIAVLIWLYSESENVKLHEALQFNIRLIAPPGQQLLISPATKRRVRVTVRCATSQYAQLQRMQARPITFTVTEDPNTPEQTLILRDKLNDSPIGDLGVNIVDIDPRTLDLHIERIEEVAIPIATDSIVPADIQLATAPTVTPSKATVGLPVSIANQLGDMKLEVRLAPETIAHLDENVPHELSTPITLPDILQNRLRGYTPSIKPAAAMVTLTIRKQSDAFSLTGVPILLSAPWAELNRFSVQMEDNQRVLSENVQLSGPSDVIDKIRKGGIKIWADLRLTADELESGITSKPLHISVPPGVRVESTIPHANFVITPIPQAAQ